MRLVSDVTRPGSDDHFLIIAYHSEIVKLSLSIFDFPAGRLSVEDAASNPANKAITTADGASTRRHDRGGSANDSRAVSAGAASVIDPPRAHDSLSVMGAP
jgi:hypothetical protein